MTEKIDFVVLWVDCNDPDWIASYNHYRPEKPIQDKARFRNWDIFRYWFRAVEKYAPWVNKVFLVTNGKFPTWINPNCDKLVLIKHTDYIPAKYLPTFNSNTIEMNLGRIESLSEHFVYFNDDTFINAPVEPKYFFRDGLPCDYNFESPFWNPEYTKQDEYGINPTIYYNVSIVNNHFNRNTTIRQAWKKWYGRHLGCKGLLLSMLLLGRSRFEHFWLSHYEQPMLKSVFKEVWEEEEAILDKTCACKFREPTNLNQYLIRFWQFASNRFYPVKKKGLVYYRYEREYVEDLLRNLKEEHFQSICINDSPYCTDEDFKYASEAIRQAFEHKLPQISIFEKETYI